MKYSVNDIKLTITADETLVRGSVAVCHVEFEFDASWDDFPSRTAVFRHSKGEKREQLLDAAGRCDIPWEVLQECGLLYVGVYGETSASRRPTVWAAPKPIHPGAEPSEPAKEPTLDKWQQILAFLDTLVSPTVEVEAIAGGHRITITDVNGQHTFDVMDGTGGGGGSDAVVPHIGENGNWYVGTTDTGVKAQGEKGDPGDPGDPGRTPVRGKDYWTEADRTEMVEEVLAALPNGDEVSY